MSASLPSLRFWKLFISSVPFSCTRTRGVLGTGAPFLRHVIAMGSSPWTWQSSMSGRSLTAITSVGSTKKESSEAQQPPADRGKTKLLLSFIYSVNKMYFNYNFQPNAYPLWMCWEVLEGPKHLIYIYTDGPLRWAHCSAFLWHCNRKHKRK